MGSNLKIKIKNRILAIPAAAVDIPVNPKIAATIAMIKKINTQYNVFIFKLKKANKNSDWLTQELSSCEFKDKRLDKRFVNLARKCGMD